MSRRSRMKMTCWGASLRDGHDAMEDTSPASSQLRWIQAGCARRNQRPRRLQGRRRPRHFKIDKLASSIGQLLIEPC
uniref:Uncharacterized protein n=1 Tax=Aegilops tauschii subsp. strangulata TaxID=200361 RepID=A0A453HM16_AEGTS